MLQQKEQEEYDHFIEGHARGHFLQTKEWAGVKKDWIHEEIIVRDKQGTIKGSMSLLIRVIPVLKKSILYCPRGPVCDIFDIETINELLKQVKKIGKKYKGFIFRMDPDIAKENILFIQQMQKLGLKTKKQDATNILQPKCVFRLLLANRTEQEVWEAFHSKTRYNIRLAVKKGVIIREGMKQDLEKIYPILEETGKRDHFYIRPLEYFERIYDNFIPNHGKLWIAEYLGQPISMILNITYSNKTWYLYGASSNQYRNKMPNYLLQWEAIKQAIKEKNEYYDFRGMLGCTGEPDSPGYGLYRFKKGFQPELIEFVDEFYMVLRPITNVLYNFMEKIYKEIFLEIILRKSKEEKKQAVGGQDECKEI